jgi:ubiquinone/menaquinone biosynthesis C-methylase UbiE
MSLPEHSKERIRHWDSVARNSPTSMNWGRFYQRRLQHIYRHLSAASGRTLEIGCGKGDLLAAIGSPFSVGVDFSHEMLQVARVDHPEVRFVQADAHALPFAKNSNFNTVILSDLVNDVWDVLAVFKTIAPLCRRATRILINTHSHLWEPVLRTASYLRLSKPNLPQNWITVEDLANILRLTGFEVIRSWQEVLLPLPIPILSSISNRFLVRLWPFRHFAIANMIAARKIVPRGELPESPSVSVVIPARNEEGNIPHIFERMPPLTDSMELIFVEGHSEDDTYGIIEREIRKYPHIPCRLIKQSLEGKGNAVREGFEAAKGDVLIILDADLSVPPETLKDFYAVISSDRAEFVNGVRLVYPMEPKAMRFFNLVGNKLFSYLFSWLLGQPVKDTLCGTKVLWKDDYATIELNRTLFGDFDPFGDFDLLLGAARLNLKIVDLPVRYHSRSYGQTNIDRWGHGLLLFKMAGYAAMRLKFV